MTSGSCLFPYFSFFLGANLEFELTKPTFLDIKDNSQMNPSSSTSGSSNMIDISGYNSENINKLWMDFKLIKHKGM